MQKLSRKLLTKKFKVEVKVIIRFIVENFLSLKMVFESNKFILFKNDIRVI